MLRGWIQYDLLSTLSSICMMMSNALRSTFATSSYSTDSTRAALKSTQGAFILALAVHIAVTWVLLYRPHAYMMSRELLTCSRWLTVSGLVVASTQLPVFQQGAQLLDQWWLMRWLGLGFRTGIMFCVVGFVFYRMPCPYMAAMGFTYALCSSVRTAAYCSSVMELYGSQPHADLYTLHEAAAVLDLLSGQGQMLQQEGQQPSASAFEQHHQPDVVWQGTAGAIWTTCNPERVLDAELQQACRASLQGQCQATVNTLMYGITYVMMLCLMLLERFERWKVLQQQSSQQQQRQLQQQQQTHVLQQPHMSGVLAEDLAGSSAGANWASSRDQEVHLLSEQHKAPTAGAFWRMELLKLLVLADLPVLFLWWGLSSYYRPPLPLAG